MQSLKNLIPQRLNLYGIKETVNASMIVEKFNELLVAEFGEKIVKNQATAVYVKQKSIYVVVLSSVLSQELKFKEKQLIEILNDYYTQEVLEKVYCIGQ